MNQLHWSYDTRYTTDTGSVGCNTLVYVIQSQLVHPAVIKLAVRPKY